jgi:hypothetical protein
LLGQLWGFIYTESMESLELQIQTWTVHQDTYRKIADYSRLRKRSENHFYASILEDAFSEFDEVLNVFRENFTQLTHGTNEKNYYSIGSEGMKRDIWWKKFDRIESAFFEAKKKHFDLAKLIKTLYPEFDFTVE